MIFVMQRPAKLEKVRPESPVRCTAARGDIDNLMKAVFDALNTIVWCDDKQVTTVLARKRYTVAGEKPGVSVLVFNDLE
jgi:Holliday junction resolvase RusA-like endonuclease